MPRLPGRIRVLCGRRPRRCSPSAAAAAAAVPPRPAGLEKTNLVVAAVPAMDSAGLYIAQQRGLLRPGGPARPDRAGDQQADVIKQQLAGQFDITGGRYPSYILADEQHHADFKVLVAGSDHGTEHPGDRGPGRVAYHRDGPSSADKTIAVDVTNNIGQLLVASILQDNAVPGKVHFDVQSFPAMGPLLAQTPAGRRVGARAVHHRVRGEVRGEPLADSNQGTTRTCRSRATW